MNWDSFFSVYKDTEYRDGTLYQYDTQNGIRFLQRSYTFDASGGYTFNWYALDRKTYTTPFLKKTEYWSATGDRDEETVRNYTLERRDAERAEESMVTAGDIIEAMRQTGQTGLLDAYDAVAQQTQSQTGYLVPLPRLVDIPQQNLGTITVSQPNSTNWALLGALAVAGIKVLSRRR